MRTWPATGYSPRLPLWQATRRVPVCCTRLSVAERQQQPNEFSVISTVPDFPAPAVDGEQIKVASGTRSAAPTNDFFMRYAVAVEARNLKPDGDGQDNGGHRPGHDGADAQSGAYWARSRLTSLGSASLAMSALKCGVC
jgi:hypothetical protein